MCKNEIELLNVIRNDSNPENAMIIAIEIISNFVKSI